MNADDPGSGPDGLGERGEDGYGILGGPDDGITEGFNNSSGGSSDYVIVEVVF